mmetsp:Transcript_52991/g.113695  ORF Transcript_52991/g.113695 Transcript_52991/m.113695 type:complete len:371 (+) Transcript_52991:54-1166(+)
MQELLWPAGPDWPMVGTECPTWPAGEDSSLLQSMTISESFDTLHILLPADMDLHAVTCMFHNFGDISCLEMVPYGDYLDANVVFFDVRAAAAAYAELGGDSCWPAQGRGSRTVRLPSTTQLCLEIIEHIICQDPGEAEFVVECYDLRDAELLRQAVADEAQDVAKNEKALCGTAWGDSAAARGSKKAVGRKRPSGRRAPRPVPAYVVPTEVLLAGQAAAETSSRVPDLRETVLIHGLPAALATRECMEAILQQAGLRDHATSLEVWAWETCGEALACFCGSLSAAEHCVRHLEGCRLERAGVIVSARIVTHKEADAVRAKHGSRLLSPPPRPSPLLPLPGNPTKARSGSSAGESTEAGPSEASVCEEFVE